MGALEELSQAVTKVSELTAPAVVGIGGHWRRGSGVIVAANRVLTNSHNVHGDGATVVFADGHQERGTLLGEDADGDLAVLEVDTGGVAPLVWVGEAALPAAGAMEAKFHIAEVLDVPINSVRRFEECAGIRAVAGRPTQGGAL